MSWYFEIKIATQKWESPVLLSFNFKNMEEKLFQEIKELKDQIESLSLSTKEILTLEEAVTYLQVSKSYLYKLTFKKEIPFYKPSGKLIYFKREDLTNWMLSNKQLSNHEVENDIFNSLKRGRNGK